MPAYNEEGCIAAVVQGWLAEFDGMFGRAFRLIVVNDGSRDRTGEILDRLAAAEPRLEVIHQPNSGHGGALLRGYAEAVRRGPDRVFQVDSDDQFDPADFRRLWEKRAASPCILGYRATRHDAFHRLVITRIVRLVLAVLYGCRITDSNVPFRLLETGFLRRALALIPPTTFAPNIFVAVLGARSGADLMHIPIAHRERRTGKVSIMRWKLVRVCFRCVGELLAFRRIVAENAAVVKSAA